MLAVISLLTAPEYFEYTPDLVTVTETGVGEVTISFNSKVTNYKLQHIEDPDESAIQFISWKRGLPHGTGCLSDPERKQ